MKKLVAFFGTLSFLLFLLSPAFTQTVIISTGQEQAKATVNFTSIANYELLHPPVLVQQQPENEAESVPSHPFPDTTLIHRRNHIIMGPLGPLGPAPVPNLPPSPSPLDSFEAVPDPGTVIPPDTHGAVDSNYCVTAVNPNIRIQSRLGSTISTVTLNGFWSAVISSGTFDPRVHYDLASKRWIMVAVGNAQSSNSCILIGASQTSNPTGNWYLFSVKADSSSVNWLDYPDVGFNKNWIVVTGNYFTNANNTFTAGKMFIFNKANILSGTSANYTSYSNSNDFTFCPAITYDTTLNNLFVMESWDGTNGLLKLMKISGTANSPSVSTIGYPSTSTLWQSDGNANNFAPQLGTTNLVSANDDRITQLVYMNHSLWCAQTIFLPYSTSASATRCSIQWWQTDTNANPIQVGLIDDATNTNFYTFPSMAVNNYNDALIGFSVLSANIHPSAAYAMRSASDPSDSMRPFHMFRAGQNTYYKTFSASRNRWGDYSGTVLDPLNQSSFWTIQEASATTANDWDTWWAEVNTCNLYTSSITASGPVTFCQGGAVTLYADSGSGYSYQWKNGGNNIAGATGTSYNAATSGSYTLVISKNNCTITSPVTTVTMNGAPVIGPITGGSATCVGSSSLTLSDTTQGGTWSSDNISVASVSSTGFVAGNGLGTVTIRYTATNGLGCTDSVLKTITVGPQPAVAPITGPGTVCDSSTITLSDTSANGTWSSSNTSLATVNSSGQVFGVSAGSLNISYTVTNGIGCSASTTVPITVSARPVLPAISGQSSLCQAASITLSNTNNNGTWSSANTGIATVNSSGSVSGISAGTVNIMYSISNSAGCSDTVFKSVTVNPLPVVGPISGLSSVCSLASTPFTDTSAGGAWSSDNTSIATVNSSGSVTGIATGTTHIVYTVTNGFSCTDSAVQAITVNVVPVLGSINGTPVVCVGATTTLSNTNNNGSWTASNGNATITTVGVVTGVTAGMDTITYTVSNTCGADSVTKVVIVNPLPQPGTISGADTICIGQPISLNHTGTAGTWGSSNNNASVSGLGVVTATTAGADTIFYAVTNSCGTKKVYFPITIRTSQYCDSIAAVPAVNVLAPQISVYPNPNDGTFMVEISSITQEPIQIRITNVVGQSVAEYKSSTNSKLNIKIEQPSGIYFLNAKTLNSSYTTKITISK